MTRPWRVLLLAVALVLIGGFIAWRTHTAGGRVAITDVRWVTPSGQRMSGLLYVPRGVSAEQPAPGIVAIHGYINSRETQAGFAIEFARRGYVVLAVDQTGHGYSGAPAFSGGFGGPAALAYLRSLDFVDAENIGLEGHSMGGWASGMAAAGAPDAYRSIALVGSSTGSLGVPQGTPEWPRNLAVVFSVWDEFSQTMWGTPRAGDIGRTPKLQAVFGTDSEVEPRRLYGSIEDGTARMLYQPRTNHPGDHLSREAIGNTIEWFQMTLQGGSPLPPDDQIWYWKEFGTLASTIGMVLLMFPVATLLLGTNAFGILRADPVPVVTAGRAGWGIAAAFAALLGPLTLFTFKDIPGWIDWTPSTLFPQSITNAIVAWTTALGLVTLLLLFGWHMLANRRLPNAGYLYGLTWADGFSAGRLLRSGLLAILVVAAAYASLLATAFLFQTDFRFWVFAIKPMSREHLGMALVYFVPLLFFFLVLNTVIQAQLRREGWSLRRAMVVNVGVLVSGYLLLYLVQYVPLLAGGTMTIADEPLWTIISYQLLPVMTIVALLTTFLNRKTGTIYAGAIASALLVAWIIVASQATHVAI
jgi:pimeloyl-ACP methyl ester carboxylesterase